MSKNCNILLKSLRLHALGKRWRDRPDALCPYAGWETTIRSASMASAKAEPGSKDETLKLKRPSATVSSDVLASKVESSAHLSTRDIGKFYPIDETKIPEAFEQWYTSRDPREVKSVPIEGGGSIKALPNFVAGCMGLQFELSQTRYPYLMYRPAWAALWNVILAAQDESERKILLKGAPGSGKSVFLAATTEMLRQRGWLVMYIPDANDITMNNMSYSQSEETGMWDTREVAQAILKSVLNSHEKQLQELKQQVPGGSGTLYDLCKIHDQPSTSDAQLCNSVVRLKLELYRLPASTPSAVLIDNYNSLFWRSDMYYPTHVREQQPARPLDAQELTLGANLRALGDVDVGHTVVVGSPCVSGAVPRLPLGLEGVGGRRFADFTDATMPLLNVQELTTMLQWYRHVEAISPQQFITKEGVEAAYQLTQGSGVAVRKNLHFLLPYHKMLDDLDSVGEVYSSVSLYSAGGRS